MYSVTEIGVQSRKTYGDKPSSRHTIVMALFYSLPEQFTKEQACRVISIIKEYNPDLARHPASYYWTHLLNKQYVMEVS